MKGDPAVFIASHYPALTRGWQTKNESNCKQGKAFKI